MKKIIIPIIALALIIATVVIIDSVPRHDEEEIKLFEKYQEDFELITEYIIDNHDTETEDFLGV